MVVHHESLMDKYKIPVQHFEYSYIEKCTDGRELEKIVQVLRSGEEGYFPDLISFAEQRLSVVKPKSKLLRKACPVVSKEALSKDERYKITNDLTQWVTNVSKDDDELSFVKNRKFGRSNLPQVRESGEKIIEEKTKTTKRISATDYSSWDKYDPDTEILKIDLEEEKLKKEAAEKKKKTKKTVKFKEFTTDVEALHEANYEKEKGNEFFKSGDYKEALRHYTNSINCKPTLASFTNRALANIKLKKYQNSIDDCHSALAIEPECTKALLRKAQALEGLGRHSEALEAVERSIEIDPNNTVAQELATKLGKLCGMIPKGGTRFKIQEIESNRERKGQVIIPIPGTSNMSPPYYITCSDEKVREETLRANTPSQIVHLISVDNSDVEDDDGCTVNHLKKICSKTNLLSKQEDKKTVYNSDVNDGDGCTNTICSKTNLLKDSSMNQNKKTVDNPDVEDNDDCSSNHVKVIYSETNSSTSQAKKTVQQQVKEDKCAGGEPYVKEMEPIMVPQDIHSPYSFLKAWNSANGDKTLEQHASILRSMDMTRIVEVIGCKLDNTMFSTIIKCLSVHFAVPGEVERLHFILENIVNLPRFDIIAMLMSPEDRNNVTTLANFLKQHGKPICQYVFNKLFNS